MNKKTTLLSLKCLFVLSFAQVLNAQQIYTNGGLSTGATSASGVAAPAGYTWSECQNEPENTTESNTNAGFGALFTNAGTNSLQIADDFVVPAEQSWTVTSFDFYGYKTNYTGTTIPMDQMRIQIFNTDPSVPGAIPIFGNMTTNVLDAANSGEANLYRIFNSGLIIPPATAAPAAGTTRKIWRYRGNIAATLPAGTYWVVFQMHDIAETAAFFPPVTILGSRGAITANAKQNVVASTTVGAVLGWTPIFDTGNPATAPDFNQDFPFLVNGTVTTLGVNQNDFNSAITISPNPMKNTISISNDSDAVLSSIEIVDLNGKIVKKVTGDLANQINVSNLSSGVYFVTINSDKGTVTKKVIKE